MAGDARAAAGAAAAPAARPRRPRLRAPSPRATAHGRPTAHASDQRTPTTCIPKHLTAVGNLTATINEHTFYDPSKHDSSVDFYK